MPEEARPELYWVVIVVRMELRVGACGDLTRRMNDVRKKVIGLDARRGVGVRLWYGTLYYAGW